MWRNVLLLGSAQALGSAAASLFFLVGGIVGQALAPGAALATLPIATLVIGVALSTVPAALWMRRVGRRRGLASGAALGIAGSLLAARALFDASFAMLCAAALLLGASLAFVAQYRFAAAESVPPDRAGAAVGLVLLGGIIAGVLGPEVGRRARTWLDTDYAGAFLALAVLQLAGVVLIAALRAPPPVTTPHRTHDLRILDLLRRPDFALALAAAVTAYAVMTFIMIGTPISMHVFDGHSLDATAHVIQGHVAAMYAPSLAAGFLVDRIGVRRMMTAGSVALLACTGVAASSHTLAAYAVALTLLGLGWNLLFVGGTVLLTRSYRSEERFRAQGLNDFIVFGTQAIAALGAGAALHRFGWTVTNLVVAPMILLMLALITKLGRRVARVPVHAKMAEAESPAGG